MKSRDTGLFKFTCILNSPESSTYTVLWISASSYSFLIFQAYPRLDQFQDKEGKVRSALQHILKCDLEKENIMDPIVLPPADCIISFGLLDMICKKQDDYIRYLRKLLKLLKPGGHIIIFGTLEMTFYTIGKHKFHAFNYDEDFARKALVGEGLIIDRCEVKKRTVMNDHNDYKGMIFIAAHKEM
ncbi:unnamed protein product [Ranitomeya imitator]|uniref:Methyltransferase type 11 domain-containing protein n=1 Tax=Ranitomeya imitator TaxID=111125 RepID=A0ABN9MLV3_9NEOB|nr:unnamed protein product [Ranitomeya imitator]